MTVYQQLLEAGVVFVPKHESWLMRAIGWIVGDWFMLSFVTTLRFPFRASCIYYPSAKYAEPEQIPEWLLAHELHHVWQFAPWYGPPLLAWRFLTPGGRLKIERRPMLEDIRREARNCTEAAQMFRRRYRWPYPESWMPDLREMVGWFMTHLNDEPMPW